MMGQDNEPILGPKVAFTRIILPPLSCLSPASPPPDLKLLQTVKTRRRESSRLGPVIAELKHAIGGGDHVREGSPLRGLNRRTPLHLESVTDRSGPGHICVGSRLRK